MKLLLATLATLSLTFTGCTSADPVSSSAYLQDGTDEPCEPDMNTMVPSATLRGHRGQGNGRGGHNSPTGIPGDNIDDEKSGKVDCYWDGNSGQGDDKHGCEPPPGCDANGCCENPGDGTPSDPDGGSNTPDGDSDGGMNPDDGDNDGGMNPDDGDANITPPNHYEGDAGSDSSSSDEDPPVTLR